MTKNTHRNGTASEVKILTERLARHRNDCARCSAAARTRQPAASCDQGWYLAKQLQGAKTMAEQRARQAQERKDAWPTLPI